MAAEREGCWYWWERCECRSHSGALSLEAGELGNSIGVSSNLSSHACLGVPFLGQRATAYLGQMLRAFVGLAPEKKKGEQE